MANQELMSQYQGTQTKRDKATIGPTKQDLMSEDQGRRDKNSQPGTDVTIPLDTDQERQCNKCQSQAGSLTEVPQAATSFRGVKGGQMHLFVYVNVVRYFSQC
jgi:hypothetical protein